jgi:predicted DNA-binding antitoxin AbrB/MazE fold protein
MSQPPKKPKQPRSKRLKVSKKEQWTNILKEIEAKDAPISCMESIQVNLKDGTSVIIDIKQLVAEGNDPELIEYMIQSKLKALDHIINDVDFYISVDSVAKVIQPITDNILKDL